MFLNILEPHKEFYIPSGIQAATLNIVISGTYTDAWILIISPVTVTSSKIVSSIVPDHKLLIDPSLII